MEQARRPTLAHHVHRTAPMGPRVLINGIWYYTERGSPQLVMPGLDPGIHRKEELQSKTMDCRVKPGNDGGWIGVPMKWPRIRSRRTTAVSPWVSIIAREVEFSRGAAPPTYHAVEQSDYISIVALTPSGKIPIVRQYRPALEAFAWELPAGLVDPRGHTAARPR